MFVSGPHHEWMQKQHAPDGQTFYDCFVFPQMGLNGRIKGFEHCPVGNSPKFMPWDTNLFMDFNLSLWWHKALTAHLQKDNPRKFSSATLAALDNATRWILDPDNHVMGHGGIESKRIQQDVDKSLLAHFSVVESNGTAGDGFGNCTGS